MTTTPFQFGKEYPTRDGGRARVYATDGAGLLPIHGAVWHERDKHWRLLAWHLDGCYNIDGITSELDLIPPTPAPPETETWWLNRYESGAVSLHNMRANACLASKDQVFRGAVLIDCVPVQLPPLPKPKCATCGREMP